MNVHPWRAFVSDPSGLAPLCGEAEFAALCAEMVADEAPRLFAVVQEYGERVDGRIAGWGMAFADRAEVVSLERRWLTLQRAQDVMRPFTIGGHVRARLVWVDPAGGSVG